MNSKEYITSAIIIRCLDFLGVISNQSVSFLKRNEFKINNENIWCGYVNMKDDEETKILFLFSENENCKYMSTKMISNKIKNKSPWYFFICCDDTGEDYSNNQAFMMLSLENNKISEAPLVFLLKLAMGFETLRLYVPYLLPYSSSKEDIDIFKYFISKINIVEEEEDDSIA